MKTIQCVIFVYLVVLSYTPIQSSSMKITIIIVKWTLPCQLTVTQHEKLQHYIPECSKSPLFQAFFKRKPTNRGWRLTTVMLQFEKMVSYFHTVCLQRTQSTARNWSTAHGLCKPRLQTPRAAAPRIQSTATDWGDGSGTQFVFISNRKNNNNNYALDTRHYTCVNLALENINIWRQKDSSEGKKYRSGADTYSCCTFHQNNYRMDKVCWMR